METKNWHHYTIIFISIAWSTYISAEFLQIGLSYYASLGLALALSLITHKFLMEGCKYWALHKKISYSILLTLIGSGVIAMFDFQGSGIKIESNITTEIESKYKADIESLSTTLSSLDKTIQNNSDWAEGKRKDWSKHAVWDKASSQRVVISDSLEKVKNKMNAELNASADSIELGSMTFRGISILFLIMSVLASLSMNDSSNVKIVSTREFTPNANDFDTNENYEPAKMIGFVPNEKSPETKWQILCRLYFIEGERNYAKLSKKAGLNGKQIKEFLSKVQ